MESITTNWQAYREQGNLAVRDQLLNEHLGLVHHVARQLSRSLSVDATSTSWSRPARSG